MSDELTYTGLDDETKADLREKLAVKRQVASQATHLAALLDAATPLPWRVTEGDLEGGTLGDYIARLLQNRQDDGTSTGRLWLTLAANDVDPERGAEVVPAMTGDGPRAEANARLVVAAVNALPELLDAAARAEAEAADLRRWKAEALPVLAGLLKLGRTLGRAAKALMTEVADLRARLAKVEALHRPDGDAGGPGAMCVACTRDFGTPAEDPVPWPCATVAALASTTEGSGA